MNTTPLIELLPISLRAYAVPQFRDIADGKQRKGRRKASKVAPSAWVLLFDTETSTDAGQALRFGTFQLRKADELREQGIFYDPEGVSAEELATISAYASENGLELLTRDHFVDQVFYRIGYFCRALIVGFNLPFDISRIAIGHNSARGEMRGGFTFKLSPRKNLPHVQVKHRSSRCSFIRFAKAAGRLDSRGERKRGLKAAHRGGHFLDLKASAGAQFARSFSLRTLSQFLKVQNPKLDFDDFAGPITDEMVRYAVRDVQTTWECYVELRDRFGKLELDSLPHEKVYSEASIGKGYLRQMGVDGWRKLQPEFPAQLVANIMGAYFGGRSEVRIRRELRQVILCDFLSMYPTVCVLMGLWRFVIAQGIECRDATAEVRQLLAEVDLKDIQSPSFWGQLTTLVRVRPDADIFPVRASYSGEAQSTIGLNVLSSDTPHWFTLPDCVASKLLTGKAPEVVEAISFAPGPIQQNLKPININGDPDYRVDPSNHDFFKRTIELRQSIKRQRDAANGEEKERLDTIQNALKIAANATSYGIYVEVNVETRNKPFSATVLSSTNQPFSFKTDKAEEPGPFFHPLLATMITGAARLMLATAERLVADSDLEWSFCDTDSIAIARPEGMDPIDFANRAEGVVNWFTGLNPYEFGGSILKIEDQNKSLIHPLKREDLYCWAVSAKRYALFNLSTENQPVMRKVSAHGLGHLRAPYGSDDAPANIPAPHPSVLSSETQRWHSDFWFQIVSAALAGHPDRVDRDYHPALSLPAVSRYAATTPELLRWFRKYNEHRSYRQQVKPFGFLLSLQAGISTDEEIIPESSRKGRKRSNRVKPIASFDNDVSKALPKAFDRDSGKAVQASSLKSYADALLDYHIHRESKFLNGDYLDRGMTRRRHVQVATVQHIGKEANNWEQQAVLGLSSDALPIYGVGTPDPTVLAAELGQIVSRWRVPACAKAFGVAGPTLRKLIDFPGTASELTLQKVASRLPGARRLFARATAEAEDEAEMLKRAISRDGLRATARRLGVDASNLRRKMTASTVRQPIRGT